MKRLIALLALAAALVACTPSDNGGASSPDLASPDSASPAISSPGISSPAMESPAMESMAPAS